MLRLSNPDELTSEELSDKIRSVPVAAAQNVLPVKTKDKFSSEFSTDTIQLIQQKRKLWLFLQNPVSESHVHCERPTENYAETLNRQYPQIILHCLSRKQNSCQIRLSRTGLRAISY